MIGGADVACIRGSERLPGGGCIIDIRDQRGAADEGEARLLEDGTRIAIYGVPTDPNGMSEDVARVLLIDPEQQRVAAELRLDGVRDWQRQVEHTSDQPRYEFIHNGLAWDTVRELLYVAHASDDRLTVVDLAAAAIVRQTEVLPWQGVLDRLRELFASTARAKMVPGTTRYAALGSDGQRLYVWGMRSEQDGSWPDAVTWREIPLGLQVIDPRTDRARNHTAGYIANDEG